MSECIDKIIADLLISDLVPVVLQYLDPNKYWDLVSKPIQLHWEHIHKIVKGKDTFLYRRLHSFDGAPIIKNGVSKWYKNGVYHRDNDLPAMICHSKQTFYWYINGILHRENDLPAIESLHFSKWYKHGILHRDGDLPCVIIYNNTIEYWKNGKLHRDNNLPAVIRNNGLTMYYVNGLLHRDDDLPAIEHKELERKEWFRHGVPFRVNPMDPTKEFAYHKEWHDSNGNLHREGGLPAYISDENRVQKWFIHGVLHRDDDLPAIEYLELKRKEWFRHGVPFRVNPMDPTKECIVYKEWHDSDGNLHREGDLPAYISDEYKVYKWCIHGKLHRVGAPALIFKSTHEYYENGHLINRTVGCFHSFFWKILSNFYTFISIG